MTRDIGCGNGVGRWVGRWVGRRVGRWVGKRVGKAWGKWRLARRPCIKEERNGGRGCLRIKIYRY